MAYWLMKSEPDVYSIDHLIADTTTQWEGVRNYQARNFMRDDMKIGDKVLFYHSNTKPPGIVGVAEVCKESYPDFFAWDQESKYFDPKSPEEKPRWFMVDVKFVKKFKSIISLDDLKTHPELVDMLVIRKGQRLSVQPVDEAHFNFVVGLS
jgi:predicted RNA-binding protein with PUA-like domain